jgi:hypothetical protein
VDTRIDYSDVVAFQQALRRSNAGMKTQLKGVNKEVAQLVVERAQGTASGVGRQAAKAAASLRASNTVGAAQVMGGSARLPWFAGAEFGAKRYAQFKPWRGNAVADPFGGGAGWFLYPTIRSNREPILDKFNEAMRHALAPAWPT